MATIIPVALIISSPLCGVHLKVILLYFLLSSLFSPFSLFRVYNPAKPIKYGVLTNFLNDSATGYQWNMNTYHGVSRTMPDLVNGLLGNLKGHGRVLYMDNLYNSVALTTQLVREKVHVCGTLRTNRGEPQEIKTANPAKGEVVAVQNGEVMVMAWKDKRIVKMVSTLHNDEMAEVGVRRRGHRERVVESKPKCILQYNAHMNAVDRMDQMLSYYPFVRRSVKWHKKYVMYLFQISLHNSYILFREDNPHSKVNSLYHYITACCKALTQPQQDSSVPTRPPPGMPAPPRPREITPRAPTHDPPRRLNGNPAEHCLVQIVSKGKKPYPSKKCRVCKLVRGEKKDTRYVCRSCAVPLHIGDCYSLYHSKTNL